jgi:hypothetical protein
MAVCWTNCHIWLSFLKFQTLLSCCWQSKTTFPKGVTTTISLLDLHSFRTYQTWYCTENHHAFQVGPSHFQIPIGFHFHLATIFVSREGGREGLFPENSKCITTSKGVMKQPHRTPKGKTPTQPFIRKLVLIAIFELHEWKLPGIQLKIENLGNSIFNTCLFVQFI